MTDLPHVMSPNAEGRPGILKEMVLWDQDTFWLKPKYLRRGRLVEDACSMVALGRAIPDAWWARASGEREDDRVEHEEVRPYVEGVRQFLAEHDFVLEQHQLHVVNSVENYQGRIDWKGFFRSKRDEAPIRFIIDLKCGPPPPEWIALDGERRRNPLYDAYKLQTKLYQMAYATQVGNGITRRGGLHLYDGSYKWVEHVDPRDGTTALLLTRAYHLRNQYRRI